MAHETHTRRRRRSRLPVTLPVLHVSVSESASLSLPICISTCLSTCVCVSVAGNPGVCKVHSDKMLTFDGSPIILPLYTSETSSSRCKVLLAQDCSQRGLFSVSGYFKFGRWSVKMVVPSYELELVPQSSSFESVVLIVNGQQMRVSSSVAVQLPSLLSSR